MAGILRQQSKIFAENAPIRLVTAFRTAGDNPTQSKAPDVIQNETYSIGWINADNTGNLIPYAEDMNGVLYTLSYNTSYLFEKGMPEYSPEQTYYENSFCQYGGYLYRCKVDETLNIVPTNTNYWDKIETDAYSATNIGTGAGFYAGMSGTQFRFKTLIAADNSIVVDSGDDYVSIRAVATTPNLNAVSPLSYNAGTISIQAANSSQGGYLTAADWASFNGKLSGTIFSSNNSWTGTNTFQSILPDVTQTRVFGSATQSWLEGFFERLIFTTSDHFSLVSSQTPANSFLLGFPSTGVGDWGIYPSTASGTSSSLGNLNYKWDKGYIDEIHSTTGYITTSYTDWIKPTAFSSSLSQVSIGEAASWGGNPNHPILKVMSYPDGSNFFDVLVPGRGSEDFTITTIGTNSAPWTAGYFSGLYANVLRPLDSGGTIGASSSYYARIYTSDVYLSSNVRLQTAANGQVGEIYWYDSVGGASAALQLVDSCVRAFRGSSGTIDLGNTGIKWRHGYFSGKIFTGGGSSNGIYFGGDTSHSYIKDITANTLQLHGTAQINFVTTSANTEHINCRVQNNNFFPAENDKVTLGDTIHRWQTIYTNNNVNVSDRRSKEGIEDLENGLEKLNTIDVKSFRIKNHDEGIIYGFIAQDELERNPELVVVPENYSEDEDGGELMYMPNNVLFLAVKAIQELSAKVEDLKQQIEELKK